MPHVSFYRADKEQEERLKEKRLKEISRGQTKIARSYGTHTARKHEYNVYAQDKKRGTEIAATTAYGRDGVGSAKKAIRAAAPRGSLKFSLYNKTKKRKVT